MARRKTPRVARRSPAPKRGSARRSRARSAAGPRKKSTARKARPARARKSARVRGASVKQARARKATTSRVQRKTSAQTRARKSSVQLASKATRKAPARPARKTAGARTAPKRTPTKAPFVARKAPSLDRERRIVRDDDIVPTPPSSLDMDRSASAARSGRRALHERLKEHTETSPAITGGDIDADWESESTVVGDEAPGGDNPTPDQDIVDDIGKAVGVQYEDNEELKGETKITERDRKRWELDPASSEDYNDR
jgi:hypothetical protein